MERSQDAEDILADSLIVLDCEPISKKDVFTYGPLDLTVAIKEGKANTLLADHIFSPALLLAEHIETASFSVKGKAVLELGAGAGLPSLLMATIEDSPSLVVVTDYPDPTVLRNLQRNVQENHPRFNKTCRVECCGFAWGTDPGSLLELLPAGSKGFDILILSDLLHFSSSRDDLLNTIASLLNRSSHSQVHVAAGKYTVPDVCRNFLTKGASMGILFEEKLDEKGIHWKGGMRVNGFTMESLTLRKSLCRYWVGRWLNLAMGISGLLPALKSIQVTKHISEYAGQTLAVDGYVWLHRAITTCATELATQKFTHKYVDYCMHRVRLLRHHNIEPYIVFDGGPLPAKKATEIERKKRREAGLAQGHAFAARGKNKEARECYLKSVDVTPQMAYQVIKALRAENVQYVVAPYEADAQLAYLERIGLVNGILTEDSDLLVFGCQNVFFKLDTVANTVVSITRKDFGSVSRPESDITLVGWSDVQFREMAILSGCDYLPSIPGIGLKTACSLLRKWKTPDQVVRAIQLEGKKSVPRGYMDRFRLADKCFQYQRVYCPRQEKLVYLNNLGLDLDEEVESYIGSDMDPSIAKRLADGDLDPITLSPMEDINPNFIPGSKSVALASKDANRRPNRRRASNTGNGGILDFFGPNPIIPPTQPPSSLIQVTHRRCSLVGNASGKRTLAEAMDKDTTSKKRKQIPNSSSHLARVRPRGKNSNAIVDTSRRREDKENVHWITDEEDHESHFHSSNVSLDVQPETEERTEEFDDLTHQVFVEQENGYISPSHSLTGDIHDLSSPIQTRKTAARDRSVDTEFGADVVSSPISGSKSNSFFLPTTLLHRTRSLELPKLDMSSRSTALPTQSKSFSGLDLRSTFADSYSDIDCSDVEDWQSCPLQNISMGKSLGEKQSSCDYAHVDAEIEDDGNDYDLEVEARNQAIIRGWRERWLHGQPRPTKTNITPGKHKITGLSPSIAPHPIPRKEPARTGNGNDSIWSEPLIRGKANWAEVEKPRDDVKLPLRGLERFRFKP